MVFAMVSYDNEKKKKYEYSKDALAFSNYVILQKWKTKNPNQTTNEQNNMRELRPYIKFSL